MINPYPWRSRRRIFLLLAPVSTTTSLHRTASLNSSNQIAQLLCFHLCDTVGRAWVGSIPPNYTARWRDNICGKCGGHQKTHQEDEGSYSHGSIQWFVVMISFFTGWMDVSIRWSSASQRELKYSRPEGYVRFKLLFWMHGYRGYYRVKITILFEIESGWSMVLS